MGMEEFRMAAGAPARNQDMVLFQAFLQQQTAVRLPEIQLPFTLSRRIQDFRTGIRQQPGNRCRHLFVHLIATTADRRCDGRPDLLLTAPRRTSSRIIRGPIPPTVPRHPAWATPTIPASGL